MVIQTQGPELSPNLYFPALPLQNQEDTSSPSEQVFTVEGLQPNPTYTPLFPVPFAFDCVLPECFRLWINAKATKEPLNTP